jgi:hypothetical protein
MKRVYFLLILAGILLVVNSVTLAGEPAPTPVTYSDRIEVVNLFTWATGPSPKWGVGALYAFLGLIGALVTVFGLIGGAVPGTAGFVRIEAGMRRVEEREKILDKLIKDPKRNPEEIKAVEIAANNLRDDMRDDRRRQFTSAAALYALLGAFFAALLARDLIQALVIGAGWTACLGALGLKKDYAERKSMKDQTTEKLTEKLEDTISKVTTGKAPEQADWDKLSSDWNDLRMEAQVSRAL